jgi:hypothetical protein
MLQLAASPAARPAEVASPYPIDADLETEFREVLNTAASKTESEGLPSNYEKFSEAARNTVATVSEMRDFARRTRMREINKDAWLQALKLCPLWPYC